MVALVGIFAPVAASTTYEVEMPEEPKTVAVTATRSGDNVTFMVHGGIIWIG